MISDFWDNMEQYDMISAICHMIDQQNDICSLTIVI